MDDHLKCTNCQGCKTLTVKMKDLSGKKPDGLPIVAEVVCDGCDGKGYTTAADRARWYRQFMGACV